MSDILAFVRWEEYLKRPDGLPLLGVDPVTFNSSQSRLHLVEPGERLWLVSRSPSDQQYYLVGLVRVKARGMNTPDSEEARRFGPYKVIGDKHESVDLQNRLPIADALRALSFSPSSPIKPGANIGQSIQTIRELSPDDIRFLVRLVEKALASPRHTAVFWNPVVALWTKCSGEYATRFLENWRFQQQAQAFLLYDAQPWLPVGAPVFVHADRRLTLVAKFSGSEAVNGYKPLYEENERVQEAERIWVQHRLTQRRPIEGSKDDFDKFWEAKQGIRSLIYMGDISVIPRRPPWAEYGSKLLQWGMPTCVGYRYLTLTQAKALSETSGLAIAFEALLSLLKD